MKYLPMSLATQEIASKYETRRQHKHEDGQDGRGDDDEEVDLFSHRGALHFCIEKAANSYRPVF